MKTVLLHGLGQSPRDWDGVIARTAASDVDCPPLFSLGKTGMVTYSGILAGLEARYADTAQPLRVCGLSLGALLALDYAVRHIDQVDSLVLIAGQIKPPTLLVDLQNFIFRLMPEKTFSGIGLPKDHTLQLTRSMRRLDLSGKLAQVTCPVMVLCGERDHANQRAARKLAALLPHGTLSIVPGAGHEVNRDAPEAVAKLLDQ